MNHPCLMSKDATPITFHELAELYIEKRQRPVGERDQNNIRRTVSLLSECFPNIDVATFSGDALEEYQRFLIGKNYDRKHINKKLVGFIKTLYRWGARKNLVDKNLAAEMLQRPGGLSSGSFACAKQCQCFQQSQFGSWWQTL